jgi:hypothetical protein
MRDDDDCRDHDRKTETHAEASAAVDGAASGTRDRTAGNGPRAQGLTGPGAPVGVPGPVVLPAHRRAALVGRRRRIRLHTRSGSCSHASAP